MSDRSKGAQRVRSVERQLHSLLFRTMISSCSGQRRGGRGSSLALDGDLIAIAPADTGWPHMIIEVGGKTKSVKATIIEMLAQGPLPGGFIPVVVRLVDSRRRQWRWHISSTDAYDTVDELLEKAA